MAVVRWWCLPTCPKAWSSIAVLISDASAERYRDTLIDAKLLYVAMTRAMHVLDIHCVGEPSLLLGGMTCERDTEIQETPGLPQGDFQDTDAAVLHTMTKA